MFMLKSRVASLPGHIQSVYVQNILKLYSYIMAKAEKDVRGFINKSDVANVLFCIHYMYIKFTIIS